MGLYNRIENAIIRAAKDDKIMIEAAARRGDNRSFSPRLEMTPKTLREQTIKKLVEAIAMATDPENPDRSQIAEVWDNLMIDNHLASVIESRILFCQRSAFKFVDDNDTENKEISWLFERPWFDDLIYKVLFSRFQGTTLLEFYNLNADGELEDIEEIPQSHFNSKKGIVLKAAGDSNGWSYREGLESNYYLQVGRDYDLGMFEKLAFTVLGKKLGWGALLDYVEKFGVPPIFITTDREDPQRLMELFEAGANFKNNHFMVGRGNEKFETPAVGGHGTAPFDSLLDRADEQISKRVLGGSGISDEKSFVGSAEIQFKLAKDRFESDKLFFKYIFNAKIKPILIKLSPVYAPLKNYYFEWDNTESLSQKEIIDTIAKLGTIYEIDIEYISKVTGIPIKGLRAAGFNGGVPEGEAGKKPFWHG